MRCSPKADLLPFLCALALLSSCDTISASKCKDINGSYHETYSHYVPGPDPCLLCICNNGVSNFCKTIICKISKDLDYFQQRGCKWLKSDKSCCLTDCANDALSEKSDGTNILDNNAAFNLGSKLVVGLIAFSIIIFFICLIHRLRQKKIRVCAAAEQIQHLSEDPRSLGSAGYLDRDCATPGLLVDDVPCSDGGYTLWKPPSTYFPQGEPPPPYEEAIAAPRTDQALLSLSPHNVCASNTNSRSCLAVHNPSLVMNSQNGLPASSPTLLQIDATNSCSMISVNNRPLSSPAAHAYYQFNPSEAMIYNYCTGTCSTSSAVCTNLYQNHPYTSNRSVLPCSASSVNPCSAAQSSNLIAQSYQSSNIVPHQRGAYNISSVLTDSTLGAHRTIPKVLSTTGNLQPSKETPTQEPLVVSSEKSSTNPDDKIDSFRVLPTENAIQKNSFSDSSSTHNASATLAKAIDVKTTSQSPNALNYKPPLATANKVNDEASFDCITCIYNSGAQPVPPIHEDADDYRSECENCKSASSSYLDNEDQIISLPRETRTLQRGSEDVISAPPFYNTSLTLPASTKQHNRNVSARENWLTSIPKISTESSEDD